MKVTAVFASWSELLITYSITAIVKVWSIAVCLWDDNMQGRALGV